MTILFALLIAGYLLVLAEFVVPGGILGIIGAVCLLAAGVMGFFYFDTSTAILILLAEVFSGIILTVIWFRYFFDSPMGSTLVHRDSLAQARSDQTSNSTQSPLSELIGSAGTTLTPLRPSGSARINNKRYDVLTEGKMVESGKPVNVVKIDGAHIIVRESE
ncbi:MAG: NfeD family protein [Verrucomicrobiota bacterium]